MAMTRWNPGSISTRSRSGIAGRATDPRRTDPRPPLTLGREPQCSRSPLSSSSSQVLPIDPPPVGCTLKIRLRPCVFIQRSHGDHRRPSYPLFDKCCEGVKCDITPCASRRPLIEAVPIIEGDDTVRPIPSIWRAPRSCRPSFKVRHL